MSNLGQTFANFQPKAQDQLRDAIFEKTCKSQL